MDEDFSQKLINAKSVEEFISIIDDAETAKDNAESEQVTTSDKKILAVTGCPTGIAHTYMAAEGLQKRQKKQVVRLKLKQEVRAVQRMFLPNLKSQRLIA